MSELFNIQVNAQKENLKKYFRGSWELPQAHEKVCDKNETNKQTKKKKNDGRLNIFVGRKEFIRLVRKARVMNIKRLQLNDS